MTVIEANLLNHDLYTSQSEHAEFARLRRDAPIFFHPEPDGGPGFWAVMNYELCNAVVMAPDVFLSGGGTQITDRRAEGKKTASVHNMDAPGHQPLRARAMPGLRRTAIAKMSDAIEKVVTDLVDACPDDTPFDFVEKVALPLPMMVLGMLLGIPEEDQPKTVDWANTITDHAQSDAAQASARAELFQYYRHLVDLKRDTPDDSLAASLAFGEVDDKRLSQDELDAYFMVLTAAGNETTRFLVSGGIEQLAQLPDAADTLRRAPAGLPVAVEEMARWVTPVRLMRRTAARDTELAGHTIRAGDKVVPFFVSANRDEAVFDAPQSFNIARKPNPHLGFGKGAHFCLGVHAARLEAQKLFECILARKTKIELAGPPEKMASYMFSGHSKLPIRWH
ncbi:MAG: cytochrome P450 [Maritimibacter sp.]